MFNASFYTFFFGFVAVVATTLGLILIVAK